MSKEKIHPVKIPGRALRSNRALGVAIGQLRYDQQPVILEALAKELGRQYRSDKNRGRVKLAALLGQAEMETLVLRQTFRQILKLCRPYMKGEFAIWPEAKKIKSRK